MPCRLVNSYRRFGRTCCLHHYYKQIKMRIWPTALLDENSSLIACYAVWTSNSYRRFGGDYCLSTRSNSPNSVWFVDTEYGGTKLLKKVGDCLPIQTASYPTIFIYRHKNPISSMSASFKTWPVFLRSDDIQYGSRTLKVEMKICFQPLRPVSISNN
jgi:hypothetical protein